jgi:hypothetical protein
MENKKPIRSFQDLEVYQTAYQSRTQPKGGTRNEQRNR